jgi:hypothetical protein
MVFLLVVFRELDVLSWRKIERLLYASCLSRSLIKKLTSRPLSVKYEILGTLLNNKYNKSTNRIIIKKSLEIIIFKLTYWTSC